MAESFIFRNGIKENKHIKTLLPLNTWIQMERIV